LISAVDRVEETEAAMGRTHEPIGDERQLTLNARWTEARSRTGRRQTAPPLCKGCREREARYGFRDERDEPPQERPRTLCFECFRMELDRRRLVAARLARGWNAEPLELPLESRLRELTQRRRRAQIAARRAIGE
jgi:hypothetical protein